MFIFANFFMSYLKNKSEINFASAELLHTKNYYPAVVHCSYYSCIQLMKHIWLHKMNKTEDELSQLNRNSVETSHQVLINQIGSFLKSKNSVAFRDFNNTIGQLKKIRNDADYKDIQIDFAASVSSISLSKESLNALNKCL
jgi:hypothetical protein